MTFLRRVSDATHLTRSLFPWNSSSYLVQQASLNTFRAVPSSLNLIPPACHDSDVSELLAQHWRLSFPGISKDFFFLSVFKDLLLYVKGGVKKNESEREIIYPLILLSNGGISQVWTGIKLGFRTTLLVSFVPLWYISKKVDWKQSSQNSFSALIGKCQVAV